MGMTLKELQTAIASYVDASKQAAAWSDSTNNLAGLLDKIAKTVQIDGLFADKLPQLDGEELPLGKTVEEYFTDLVPVSDYDNTGANALSPSYPTYRPASYNYTLGRKKFKTTLAYDNYERACNSPEEFQTMANTVLKRLYDSYALFKFDSKKQILANIVAKCNAMKAASIAEYDDDATTEYAVNALVKHTVGANVDFGIVVKAFKPKAGSVTSTPWATAISSGLIVDVTGLTQTLAIPENNTTGEAFVEQVKKDVESAQFATEGHSLNGNAVGSEQGLLLIVKKGVKPILDVQVEAGAFHPDKLVIPAEIVVVDDIPETNGKCYAILMDKRMARLHPSYMAVREQLNGEGDFMNYILHTENTAFISKNTFVKCYLDD